MDGTVQHFFENSGLFLSRTDTKEYLSTFGFYKNYNFSTKLSEKFNVGDFIKLILSKSMYRFFLKRKKKTI